LNIPHGVSARELIRAPETDGFVKVRTKGSHRRFKHSDGRATTVSYHKESDTIPIGTLVASLFSRSVGRKTIFAVSTFSNSPKGFGAVSLKKCVCRVCVIHGFRCVPCVQCVHRICKLMIPKNPVKFESRLRHDSLVTRSKQNTL